LLFEEAFIASTNCRGTGAKYSAVAADLRTIAAPAHEAVRRMG
jgi:hypothetical protein